MPISKAEREVHRELLTKQNVVGVGVGNKIFRGKNTGKRCWTVMVTRKVPVSELPKKDRVPNYIDVLPTDVIETGRFWALRTGRHRPAPGGISIGHKDITAGTLGMLVKDLDTGRTAILSNNHVLANSNAGGLGDAIVQPGIYDGGTVLNDTIATLAKFKPIVWEEDDGGSGCPIGGANVAVFNFVARKFNRKTRLRTVLVPRQDQFPNLVDAALADPVDDADVINEILDIGTPKGWLPGNDLEVGMLVRKSGRTTGYTENTISSIRASVRVGYGANRTALFTDQFLVSHLGGKFCSGGDSGSIVFVDGQQVVGLLFAGSDQYTVCNHFENVVAALNIELLNY